VSEFGQPWRRVDLAGERCQLQVLDPATAFELEPLLADALGDSSALVIVAPAKIGEAFLRLSGLGDDEDFADAASDEFDGLGRVGQMMLSAADLIVSAIQHAAVLDHKVVTRLFGAMVYERLTVGGSVVADGRDWMALNWAPQWKWHAMAVQIRQTFGPLWTRSPYQTRGGAVTDGVPEPVDVPLAVQYASNLTKQGYASSPEDVLRTWTPVRMVEVIESAAYAAERERVAYEKAKAG